MHEPKPSWEQVPPTAKQALEEILGSGIVSAEIMWGGFAPNATFTVTCANNLRYFIKGAPPWQSARGHEIMALERTFYEANLLPAGVTPMYHGTTPTLDGWALSALNLIDKGEDTLHWRKEKYQKVFAALHQTYLHSQGFKKWPSFLRTGQQHLSEVDELDNVLGSAAAISKTAAIFVEPAEAAAWLTAHAEVLKSTASMAFSYNEYPTLLHCDLRDDNIVFDKKGSAWLIDWAWPTHGPLALDVIYFVQAAAANNGLPVPEALSLWDEMTGIKFSASGVKSIITLHALAYAGWASLPFRPEMPRLRTSQGFLLNALLQQAADCLNLPTAPRVNLSRLKAQAENHAHGS